MSRSTDAAAISSDTFIELELELDLELSWLGRNAS